ncbi:DUF3237 family protein [Sulfitobacter sp. HGT1]|uniref:DUF3237 family protein n=1 Tax=Sulfitobacter sp. HGT1 TaxID=2735435 RepID=UPI0020CFE244|nr:DUF3237 family protein [Sulfitobacter sp. HGT1]
MPIGETIFADRTAELDFRYAFETDYGALIEVCNYGFRHGPAEVIAAIARGEDFAQESYYMRTHARLQSTDWRYDWSTAPVCRNWPAQRVQRRDGSLRGYLN